MKFDNILTPKAEIPYTSSMGTLSGIVKDRFFMTANALIYNPANAEIRYRYKSDKVGEISVWSKPHLKTSLKFL